MIVAAMRNPGGASLQTRSSRSSTLRRPLAAGTSMPKVTPLTCRIGVVSRTGSQLTFWVCGARNTGCGICASV